VPAHTFSILQNGVFDKYPKNVRDFESSVPARILQRFTNSLFILPCGRSSDTLRQYKQEFELMMPVLLALPNFSFGASGGAAPSSPEDEFGGFALKKKKPSQKMMKKARQATFQPPPDPVMFEKLDVEYPETKQDVEDLERYLLSEAKSILQVGIVLCSTSPPLEPCCYRTILTSSVTQSSPKPSVRRTS
jgi:hypothetical protein